MGQLAGPHPQPPVAGAQVWPWAHCGLGPQRHCPAMHALAPPVLQIVQLAPPVPHADSVVPAWQTLPWQQPVQLALLHTQLPLAHRCPAAHCGPAPHRH